MEHFYQNIGEDWFSYPRLYSTAVSSVVGGRFVEVGSWKGRSASFLGVEIINSGKPIELICVDTWNGSLEHQDMECVKNDSLYLQFLENTLPIRSVMTPMRMKSVDAAKTFEDESLEFVFLDASHEYEDVRDDIESWYPKVKRGGVLAGHDYYPNGEHWQGVLKAVNEWSSRERLTILSQETCWVVNKPLSTIS